MTFTVYVVVFFCMKLLTMVRVSKSIHLFSGQNTKSPSKRWAPSSFITSMTILNNKNTPMALLTHTWQVSYARHRYVFHFFVATFDRLILSVASHDARSSSIFLVFCRRWESSKLQRNKWRWEYLKVLIWIGCWLMHVISLNRLVIKATNSHAEIVLFHFDYSLQMMVGRQENGGRRPATEGRIFKLQGRA